MKALLLLGLTFLSIQSFANSLEKCSDSNQVRMDLETKDACIVMAYDKVEDSIVIGKKLAIQTKNNNYCVEEYKIENEVDEVTIDQLIKDTKC